MRSFIERLSLVFVRVGVALSLVGLVATLVFAATTAWPSFEYSYPAAYAQDVENEELTAEEVITLMSTPQDGGVPNSYLTDTRYHCEDLIQGQPGHRIEVQNPIFGLEFTVYSSVLSSTEGFSDQACEISGTNGIPRTGLLPTYQRNGKIYMDASVILAAMALPQQTRTSETSVTLRYERESFVRYQMLVLDSINSSAMWQPKFVRVVNYLWVQFQPDSLLDESTWYLLPLLEDVRTGADMLILPSGHLIGVEIFCGREQASIASGHVFCGQDSAFEYYHGRDRRYSPGIIQY